MTSCMIIKDDTRIIINYHVMRRSKMQLSDRIENLLAVGNIIVLLLYIPLTYCQQLPPKDDEKFNFPIDQQETFQSTRIIPDGTSVFAYFYKGKSQNYFFRVENNNSPLKITISPCTATIRWVLKRGTLLPDIEDVEEEEHSDPDPDPFHAQRSVSENPEAAYRVIGNFTGKEATTYFHRRVRYGLYMLEIIAVDSDTSAKIYGTTTPRSNYAMSLLPLDKSVRITSTAERMFTIEWNKANSVVDGFNSSIQYCVVVNRVKNFNNYCSVWSAKATNEGSTAHTGFGFSWEKNPKRRSKRGNKLFHKCIGSKTKFTFKKAKLGKLYFVDVFVLNRQYNIDESYSGTKIKPSRNYLLKDGQRQTVKLQKGTVKQQVMFHTKRRLDSAVLELKSCRGKLPITMYHGNNTIHKTVVRNMKILRMRNLPEGQYTIEFTGNRNRKRVVSVLLISSIYKKPRLPLDTKVKVRATSCNSVTLSWFATHVKQRYCLYKRQSTTLPKKRSHHCLEMAGRRKKDKVLCVRMRYKDPYKPIRKIVKNLKPDTNYVFDVYVNRGKGASLSYKSVIAQTTKSCNK